MNKPLPAATVEIRHLPLAMLKPAPYNPRLQLKPTDPAFRKLEASLREFGLVEPLVWNEWTGHIVGGHCRLRILRKLRVKEVPVSVVRLTPERERALNVVLNNQEAQSRFDPVKLADLLEELEDLPELELTGFDRAMLQALRLEPVVDPDILLDPVAPDAEVTVTLTMSRETFHKATRRLNELIAEFDLISHVKET